MAQHTKPCSACPWRRTSLKGWLGASTPLQFLAQAESGIKMPCHLAVDYERDDWEEQADAAAHCAGHAAHLRNRCKLPTNPEQRALCEAVGKREDVFNRPDEFVIHHGGDASRVMGVLIGIDDGGAR